MVQIPERTAKVQPALAFLLLVAFYSGFQMVTGTPFLRAVAEGLVFTVLWFLVNWLLGRFGKKRG